MELFTKGTAVRLRSCHEKYLTAVDDKIAVRQRSDGMSQQSIWTVEMVPRKPNFIRLKSCYGKYLTASDSSFFLGLSGQKVIQTAPFRQAEYESDWEPIRDDLPVKLMSWNGKYLRANGGAPPWNNSVTHDSQPHTSTTKKWILWFVEIVESHEKVPIQERFSSPASSFNSSVFDGSNPETPKSVTPSKTLSTSGSTGSAGSDPGSLASISGKLMFTPSTSGTTTPPSAERKNSQKVTNKVSAMDVFHNAKTVRLRSSAHDKYLMVEEDEESVKVGRNGSSKEARWRVEMLPGSDKVIRLKSCHGGYLTASNERLLLGATGHKVVLSTRIRAGEPAGEWEPVKEGSKVKLKSRNGGNYLRANGGVPPWRNTVTHDSPHRTATQNWVVWDVDVIEITVRSHDTVD